MNNANNKQVVQAVRIDLRNAVRSESIPTPASIAKLYQQQASLDPGWQEEGLEYDTRNRLAVTHSISMGPSPMLNIAWQANTHWFARGYRIEMFLSTQGFAGMSNLTPVEQLDHGRCVGEAHENGNKHLSLGEGQSFITVILISKKPEGIIGRYVASTRQKWTGSPVHVAAIVRFEVDVPSLRLANDRIAQQTQFNENVVKNISTRVQVASASGELDNDWYTDRHEADVRRQTKELLATWRGVESACAEERARIESDPTMSNAQRLQALVILDRLRQSILNLRQVPVSGTRSDRNAENM
jgi:hypothetical protein